MCDYGSQIRCGEAKKPLKHAEKGLDTPEVEEVIEYIPREERMVIGVDFSGHVK